MQVQLSERNQKAVKQHIQLKKKLDASYTASPTGVVNFWLALALSCEEDKMTEELKRFERKKP